MSMPGLTVRVARKVSEALDICTFELVDASGKPLPSFSAGSHIDVQLPNGITRQYSLCNDPAESHRYMIGVLLDPVSRGGSRAMHESVVEGQLLQISGPRNHFPLVHEAVRSVLLAGGIGVTPILCMAERLAMMNADFVMHYCVRSRERTAFEGRIREASFAANVQFHYDDGPAEEKLDLTTLLAEPRPGLHLYVCGPKGFIDAALNKARALGWKEEQLHCEFFSAEITKSAADTCFRVKLASSGRVIDIPTDATVAQALADAGVFVQTSCEQGVCGTCLTRVLEGVPDHKDAYLTKEEKALNDQFTPCCSRSHSSMLVLDL